MVIIMNEEILIKEEYKICYNCDHLQINENDKLYCGKDGESTTEDDSCNLWTNEKNTV